MQEKRRILGTEAGFLSIEAIGVIILVLIGIAGGISTVSSMMRSSELATAEQQVASIVTKTKQAFAGASVYTGLTNAVAAKLDIFPDNVDSAAPKNPWGGDFTIAVATDATRFTLTLSAVPPKQCSHMALYRKGAWDSVKVGTTTVDQSTATAVTTTTACGTAPATIIFQSL